MNSTSKTVSVDDIRNELDDAVNEIMARHQVAEGIENGDCSPMDELAIDGTVTILAQKLHGLLSIQKKEQARRHSEIFYTGGGIWCAVIQMPDGKWFSGSLNGYGTIYETKEAAYDMQDGGDGFIRHTTDNDFDALVLLWETAIRNEMTDANGLSCYCDEWLEDLKKCRECGELNY